MIDPAELVDAAMGRVNMNVYTDNDIFHLEMRRIFYRTWIYVGHESEIACAGDYLTTYIGQVPVIVSRDEDGGINVLINRCAHRGTTVCQRDRGTANFFKCEYHGWVYNNKGALTGVSLAKGYGEGELGDAQRIGLQAVAAVGSYQGLIFASLNPEAGSLEDFLGNTKPYLDDWAAQTPDGRIRVESAAFQHTFPANWKLQAENNTEGYHPDFLHQAAVRVQIHNSRRARAARGETTEKPVRRQRIAAMDSRGYDLGGGHNLVETPQVAMLAKKRFPAEFLDELAQTYGPDRVEALLGPPWRMTIFPNLAIAGSNIRVIQPLAPDETYVRQSFIDLPSAPESVRTHRREQEQGFYGPAGYGGPDDIEMFTRMQEGFRTAQAASLDPWLLFTRQATSEEVLDNGVRVADSTSEITQRAVYRGWAEYMGQEA
ncbi:Rieske 2Fe-2S domain-containing protein [Nocardia sp. NPDC050799]|uniref:aromatic ring-hydroxylating oxygenase subunit alpha n=1 Tax=Nocardia sp. NPDC050799 TaxID=3154842 RepID=UPI0033E35F4A